MNTRAALIRDWQERLEADNAQIATASPRLAWLFRARARIYRLLLSMYEDGSWRSDREESPADSPSEPVRGLPNIAATVDFETGKPPKSIGDIRKRLKSVRAAVEPITPGNAEAVRATLRQRYAEQRPETPREPCCIVVTCHALRERWRLRQVFDELGIVYEVRGPHFHVPESDRDWALALAKNERHRLKLNVPVLHRAERLARSMECALVGSFRSVEDRSHLMRVFTANDITFQWRGSYLFVREEDAQVAELIVASERRLGKLSKAKSGAVGDESEVRLLALTALVGYAVVVASLLIIQYGDFRALLAWVAIPQNSIVLAAILIPAAVVTIRAWARFLSRRQSAQRGI